MFSSKQYDSMVYAIIGFAAVIGAIVAGAILLLVWALA